MAQQEKTGELFEELKSFVAQQTYDRSTTMERSTLVEDDLGVTGDDAVELLIAYSERFNVDVTNFMAVDYFKSEGWTFFPEKIKPLTLGDLEKGIIAGKLNEEVINGK
jgi:acyl carrier protein